MVKVLTSNPPPTASPAILSPFLTFCIARCHSPTRKGMDITPLVRIRERLQHARKAVSQKNVTAEDYREVDQAISGALGKLSLLRRSDQDGINSNQVQWAKPVHRPQQVEDMASAHRQAIKRLQAMVEDHNEPLEGLMLEPSKRAELAGIFQGVGDEQLRQLLRDMARTKEVRARRLSLGLVYVAF